MAHGEHHVDEQHRHHEEMEQREPAGVFLVILRAFGHVNLQGRADRDRPRAGLGACSSGLDSCGRATLPLPCRSGKTLMAGCLGAAAGRQMAPSARISRPGLPRRWSVMTKKPSVSAGALWFTI